MINFIIHEKDINLKDLYEFTILNFIGRKEEKYRINTYSKRKVQSKTIYIISEKSINKAKKIAAQIRENDWIGQIIIVSNLKSLNSDDLINNLLILDYIDYKDDIENKLKKDLFIAYKILSKGKTISFYSNHEIHKIQYQSILYIEKSNNQNYSIVHTKTNEYTIKDTINNLEKKLDEAYFLKTHRSCIVNLHNINHYNYSDNVIYFNNNKSIDLISRDKKKILKLKLIKEQIK